MEGAFPYNNVSPRFDWNSSFGIFAQVHSLFFVGGRVGAVLNNPGVPVGFGALGLRINDPESGKGGIFSPLFIEADLGVAGATTRYTGIRLGLKIL